MRVSAQGLSLIKSFEGLRLDAYICPSGVVTIGYGHTGSIAGKALKLGESINETAANILLDHDLKAFEAGVTRLVPVPLTQGQFDALVSFAFNVGLGALEESTMRKRILAGQDIAQVLREELPRWNKGPNGPLEGLTRRRNAEVQLATEQVTEQVTAQPSGDPGYMVRAAANYKGLAHQKAAYQALEASLTTEQLKAFQAAYSPAQVPAAKPRKASSFPLEVPYFYQRDSQTGHGERSCFSSAMAMTIEYLDPEAIRDDDDYLSVVFRYGDTVSSDAQVKAARSLGVPVEFHSNGTQAMLEQLLDEGVPVPIGILHKGSINRPTGGGHWITLIGYDETHFMVHDPYGELDLINGGYPKAGPNDGRNKRYSKKNLMKRWLIANDHDGWLMAFD